MLTPTTIQGRKLTRQELRWFNATIASSHHADTHVHMWKRNIVNGHRALVGPVTYTIDGQVDIDGVSRTCTMSFADPKDHWKLGTNLTFLDRILRVERHVLVPQMHAIVTCPTFTGPVIKADENGHVVSLEAHGMEYYLTGAVKQVHRWPKGAPVTQVIRQMLQLGGVPANESNIPVGHDRLPDAFQIGPQYAGGLWAAASYLAETINCDLFPDGAGVFQLRHRPGNLVWDFRGDASGTVMSQPQRSTLIGGTGGGDATSIVNDEIVFGQAKPTKPPPGGGKPPKPPVIRGEAIAKAGSRFAPGSLGNPGADLFLVERVTLEHVRLNRTAKRIAGLRLHRRLSVAVQDSFDTAPVPHLDPFDRCKNSVTGYGGTFYYTKASLPFVFTESSPHTVGYTRLVHDMARKHRP